MKLNLTSAVCQRAEDVDLRLRPAICRLKWKVLTKKLVLSRPGTGNGTFHDESDQRSKRSVHAIGDDVGHAAEMVDCVQPFHLGKSALVYFWGSTPFFFCLTTSSSVHLSRTAKGAAVTGPGGRRLVDRCQRPSSCSSQHPIFRHLKRMKFDKKIYTPTGALPGDVITRSGCRRSWHSHAGIGSCGRSRNPSFHPDGGIGKASFHHHGTGAGYGIWGGGRGARNGFGGGIDGIFHRNGGNGRQFWGSRVVHGPFRRHHTHHPGRRGRQGSRRWFRCGWTRGYGCWWRRPESRTVQRTNSSGKSFTCWSRSHLRASQATHPPTQWTSTWPWAQT